MKKLIYFVLIVLVISLVFASGCIGKKADETTTTETGATEQPSEQTTEGAAEENVSAPELEDNDVDFGELI